MISNKSPYLFVGVRRFTATHVPEDRDEEGVRDKFYVGRGYNSDNCGEEVKAVLSQGGGFYTDC